MSNQFWDVPSLNRKEDIKEIETLKIGDRIVYLWMKTHIDYTSKKCYPSYGEIAKKINQSSAKCPSECTENYVKLAIRRLESVNWIKVKRNPGSSNTYTFLKSEHFEKFYKEFLEKDLLTWREKDFYIQLQQYIFIDDEEAYFTWDYGKIAEALHLSYPTVKRYIVALKGKGVLTSTITTQRNPETFLPIIKTTVDLESIGQEALIKQVIKNTQDIQEIKEEIKEDREKDKQDKEAMIKQIQALTERVTQLELEKQQNIDLHLDKSDNVYKAKEQEN